jgi:fluoride ion exporter CrcB/FEX
MFGAMMLMRLFLATGLATGAITFALVMYENSLSIREDDQLFLNKAEQTFLASEQRKLVGQLRWLARLIYVFAAITATLLLASAGLWVWIGLRS